MATVLAGFLSPTHMDEIAAYATAWQQLFPIAVSGGAARAILPRALTALTQWHGRETLRSDVRDCQEARLG
jgi:hypothetical protein